MTEEEELLAFLRARLDEDEQKTRAAGGGEIEAVGYLWGAKYLNVRQPDGTVAQTTEFSAELADHFARHDPARVLAEVAAKRRLLDEIYPELQWADRASAGEWGHEQECALDFLKILALPYSSHPDHPDHKSDREP